MQTQKGTINFDSANVRKEMCEELVAQMNKELQELEINVSSLIEKAIKSIKRPGEIALKPNSLTEIEYLDLLIQSEKEEAKPGWQRRIEQYRKIRERALILKHVQVHTVSAQGRSGSLISSVRGSDSS